MGEMTDYFRQFDQEVKDRRQKNLEEFDPEGWTQHTEYHYSTVLLGDRLDYWPSGHKFQWRGKIRIGGVHGFIKNQKRKFSSKLQRSKD